MSGWSRQRTYGGTLKDLIAQCKQGERTMKLKLLPKKVIFVNNGHNVCSYMYDENARQLAWMNGLEDGIDNETRELERVAIGERFEQCWNDCHDIEDPAAHMAAQDARIAELEKELQTVNGEYRASQERAEYAEQQRDAGDE